MIMDTATKLLLWVDSIILAFYLGRCYARRTKRSGRKPSQKTKYQRNSTNKPLQIEVCLENNIIH